MDVKLRDHIKQRERIKELEAALEKYGGHLPDCNRTLQLDKYVTVRGIRYKYKCTCGLDAQKRGKGDPSRLCTVEFPK